VDGITLEQQHPVTAIPAPGSHRKCFKVSDIPLSVSFQLFPPPFRTGFRNSGKVALMIMPEATIYKDNHLMFRQNDVRSTWQFSIVNPVSETFEKESFPDCNLITSVTAFYSRHNPASGLFVNDIHFSIPRI
jgi:hypothetical protein